MMILGIGGLTNDAACAILRDGELVGALEEDKLRHGPPGQLPEAAMAGCLQLAGATPQDIGWIAIAKPFDTQFHVELRSRFPRARIALVEHHRAHAASAFYLSGHSAATVLTLDRKGDSRCGARWSGQGTTLTLQEEAIFPDSLGELYSRVTRMLGFTPNADEHKVQWMSAAGQPRYRELFASMIESSEGTWARLDLSRLEQVALTNPQDVAASLQRAVEDAVLRMAGHGENLCLAGGLFQNAMLVAALERSGHWRRVFVQPAAGNAGTALGAAAHAWHEVLHETRPIPFPTLALGPSYTAEEIKQVVENCKLGFRLLGTTNEMVSTVVGQLAENKIVAWMQGRMEFGPRALGYRSILASPTDPYASENLNQYIKHREAFRKFAASVPVELAGEYFEAGENAGHLATMSRVKPAYREQFRGALLGEDGIRLHTVSASENPLYHRLLLEAGRGLGLPVLYNTSFNLFGDPIVCGPRDAVRSFYSSGIDALAVGNFLLEK
ncbi:MAG: carbamoyltransferase [Bryobacteraceae bacterium]|nr:carbamoyltransferase [Bryobacteraceae bacterium]